MKSTNEFIGNNLLMILNDRGLKESDLADLLNWKHELVKMIIHGKKTITVNEIKAICNVFHIKPNELLSNDKKKENLNPIDLFIEQVKTREAKIGLKHAKKIMDMIIFHSGIRESKDILNSLHDETNKL